MAHIKPDQLRSGFYEITGSLYGTASFAITASHVDKAVVTASAVNDTITFTKGNGSTFPITLTSVATASYALNALSSSYALTASYALNALSSSYAATASYINTLYSSNYTQSFTNQSTWVVTHNLNALYVIVQVYDTNFDEIIPQNIDLTNDDTVTISFPTLESGTAVVTVGGALQTGGGGGSITIPGNNTEILFNSASALGASPNFKFNYVNSALQHGFSNIAQGVGSHAEGNFTVASGDNSHAEGDQTTAQGFASHAEGWFTSANGYASHAEGLYATSIGASSHAEGAYTVSQGNYSHAEGQGGNSQGQFSHAEGFDTLSFGEHSHAEGWSTRALGQASHTEGFATIASGSFQHVQGQYNKHGDTTSLMIVGNGTADNARRDAFKVRMSGSIVLPTTQSSAPSWTGTDGEIVPATVGGQYFLYMWMNGAWRSGSFV
jgi:hypothetical protein